MLLCETHSQKAMSRSHEEHAVEFSADAERMLLSHSWPGYIGRFGNVIERAVNLGDGALIEPRHFGALSSAVRRAPEADTARATRLEDIERQTILETIKDKGFTWSAQQGRSGYAWPRL